MKTLVCRQYSDCKCSTSIVFRDYEILFSFFILSLYAVNTGGSLHDAIVEKETLVELFPEPELRDLLLQVAMGLKYIHSSGLVHLDIKPSELACSLSHAPSFSRSLLIHLILLHLFSLSLSFFLSLVGNIFICQRHSSSTGEGESEEEEDGGPSTGVVYKIGNCCLSLNTH